MCMLIYIPCAYTHTKIPWICSELSEHFLGASHVACYFLENLRAKKLKVEKIYYFISNKITNFVTKFFVKRNPTNIGELTIVKERSNKLVVWKYELVC